MPILCNYYVTLRCNSKCKNCNIWQNPDYRNIPDADVQTVKENLYELRNAGVRFIDFTGGEPLLNPGLSEMLRTAKRLGMITSVTTNTLLYPKYAKNLRKTVDLLHFSMDAYCKETFQELRGVAGPENVFKSMEIAESLSEQPDIIFTATEANISELDKIYQETSRRKLILLINPYFDYVGQDRLPAQVLDYLEEVAKRPYTYLNKSFIKLRRNGGNNPQKPVCKAVSSTVVISPDNKLLLPCFHKAITAIPIGNNLGSLLKSDEVNRMKKQQGKFEFCSGCDINCYFEPSFATSINKYFFSAVPSKIKYGFAKFLFRRKPDSEKTKYFEYY